MSKSGWRIAGTWLLVVAITASLLQMLQPQLVAPSGTANAAFSEERAFATLTGILKEQRPHTAGSPENAVVRDRIIAELKTFGYTPDVQAAFQCSAESRNPGCASVENIIAVHKGTVEGKALLVSAHYDSVPAGPGAGDDGVGVAVVLELARTFAAKTTRNDVIFLISDGEETGLRGARAFAERHPLMRQVGMVVNFDARGASGPSMMFETGAGNRNLMDLFARVTSRPQANSVSYEIYKLLPNDTDFSVYRKAGVSGFNFGFANSASLYHSARDNLEYLDRRSLRHTGEHGLEVAGALADADLAALNASSDAGYFDILGRVMVVWPSAINVPIAIVSLLGLIGLAFAHRDAFTPRSTGAALVVVVAVPLLLFGLGWLLSYPLGIWPGVHPLDHPQPWPGRVALAMTGILVPMIAVSVLNGRVDARALLLTSWIALALFTLGVAALIGGAAYPFLWPTFGVAVAGWIETLLGRRPAGSLRLTAWVGFALAAFFCLLFLLGFELVLGFHLSQFKILVLIPFSLALVAVFAASLEPRSNAGWGGSALCAVIVVAAAATASQTPAYAPNHPRGLSITYYDDRAAKPRWMVNFVGAVDADYLKAQGFSRQDEEYLWSGLLRSRGLFRPATDQTLPAPSFTVTEVATQGNASVARGTLRSGRGGYQMTLGLAPQSGIRSVRVDGQDVLEADQLKSNEPIFIRLWGLRSREVPVEITFDAATTPKLVLSERSALPESTEGRALVAGRPADAAPAYSGDSALVFVMLELKV